MDTQGNGTEGRGNNKIPGEINKYVTGKEYQCDSIGMSDGTVLLFDNMVLKIEQATENVLKTVEVMAWLKQKLPVPEVICHTIENGKSYLLMSRIQGEMSCSEYYLEHPHELLVLLAEALKMLWEVEIVSCPKTRCLEEELAEAKLRIENNLVDISNAQPDTFGKDGFANPAELLQWLEENQPEQELVFSHGDFCLPNLFIKDGKISGFIDLGDAGIGDKWRDIALCYRSLQNNFGGVFGGRVYEGFNPNELFEYLGIFLEWEKLRYYILLDELF